VKTTISGYFLTYTSSYSVGFNNFIQSVIYHLGFLLALAHSPIGNSGSTYLLWLLSWFLQKIKRPPKRSHVPLAKPWRPAEKHGYRCMLFVLSRWSNSNIMKLCTSVRLAETQSVCSATGDELWDIFSAPGNAKGVLIQQKNIYQDSFEFVFSSAHLSSLLGQREQVGQKSLV